MHIMPVTSCHNLVVTVLQVAISCLQLMLMITEMNRLYHACNQVTIDKRLSHIVMANDMTTVFILLSQHAQYRCIYCCQSSIVPIYMLTNNALAKANRLAKLIGERHGEPILTQVQNSTCT